LTGSGVGSVDFVPWLGGLGVSFPADPLARATTFQLTLPVASRLLWLGRFQALIVALVLPLVPPVTVGVLLVTSPGTRLLLLEKTAALAAGLFAAVALVQSVRPSEAWWRPGFAARVAGSILGLAPLAGGLVPSGALLLAR